MKWIRRAVEAIREWLERVGKRPCPACGSRDHGEVRRVCPACWNKMSPESYRHMALPRCGWCGSKHLDAVLQCGDCGHTWMPSLRGGEEVAG